MNKIRKFKILSIDGGGLRGIIPLQIIREIEILTGEPIHKTFDLIAGTSTGGLLTCSLSFSDEKSIIGNTRKFDLDAIQKIYVERGKEIFPKYNLIWRNFNDFKKWLRPQFSPTSLNNILIEHFGDSRLTSCLKPIFITSYNIHRNLPVYFTTREATLQDEKNAKLVEVCRATSAAPTYFPSFSFNFDSENIVCIDGGIVMNNPAIGALVEVLGNSDYKHYKIDGERLDLKDICILSLGTGRIKKNHKSITAHKWGRINWIKPVIDIATGGPVKIVHNQISTIFSSSNLERNYLRMDIDIDEEFSEMSDSSDATLNYLLSETKSQISNNHTLKDKLKRFLDENGAIDENIAANTFPKSGTNILNKH
jgi:patatin-like phospholipase/acyl hydrolase